MRKLLYAACLTALVYETIAWRNRERGDTISEIIWRANSYPLVPFTAGMIAGHLFWQQAA